RAGAQNIVPSTTGAATALSRVIPDLKGLFDGIAVRVPTIAGSLSDITFVAKRKTTVEEINNILMTAEKEVHWQGIFKTSQEELVSSDIIGDPYASIIDLKFTRVVDGDLVKVLAWYDNEMGYVHTLVRHVIEAGVALETRN
ncbi:type I glyceraldehyde-3-phosphate dehydrogenase, partial [Candidatus Azambacteria bacterium]|nr:type I glyceraldehyde-3-phosphate dehydrogenase [Candidatus Azambacteria bacterium]